MPLLVTEQYPEKLGNIVKEFDINHAAAVYPKAFFSMYTPDIQKKIKEIYATDKLESVVLFGIEVSQLALRVSCIIHFVCFCLRLTYV